MLTLKSFERENICIQSSVFLPSNMFIKDPTHMNHSLPQHPTHPLSRTNTHTHTHTHTHTDLQEYTHSLSHTHMYTHIGSHTYTEIHTPTHLQEYTHTWLRV